jgi:hypothetical protein
MLRYLLRSKKRLLLMMAHFLSRFQYLGNNDVLFDVTLQFHTKTLRVLLQWYIRGIGRLLRLDNHVSL